MFPIYSSITEARVEMQAFKSPLAVGTMEQVDIFLHSFIFRI